MVLLSKDTSASVVPFLKGQGQGHNERGTNPRAPNHYGSAE